jgi:hypothetical protein
MLTTASRDTQATERTMRMGRVWCVGDHTGVEYAAGSCPAFVFPQGTTIEGTKRNQANPMRALDT